MLLCLVVCLTLLASFSHLSLKHTHTKTRIYTLTHTHTYIYGCTDIYIKIWLLHKGKRTKKWKSSVKQNTLTLVFNETLQFDLTGMNIHDVAMELVVMDRDRFSRDVQMGVVYVGKDVPHHTGKQHWGQVIAQPSVSISNWHPILPVTSSL